MLLNYLTSNGDLATIFSRENKTVLVNIESLEKLEQPSLLIGRLVALVLTLYVGYRC
jgi:hypothetical protein